MRIAFVLSYWQNRFGGPVTVVKSLGRSLTSAGHEISYWASGDDEDGEDHVLTRGLHLHGHDRPHVWRRSKDLVRELSGSVRSFDVMHISELWSHPTYAASRIAFDSEVPYILRPAGGLEPWRLRNGYFRLLKKRIYLDLVGRRVMERAACLQAASDQEAEGFRRVGYRGPVTVIPNGVDLDSFCPGDPSESEEYWPELKDRPVVLFMSRLSPEKGLDMLIPLWAEFVKSPAHRDAILVVAGPDYRGYGKTVERMIRDYGVASHVRMTGMLQGRRKLALFKRADVFVLPSYSENFGIVVAEALACGTPVITTTATPWQHLQTVNAGRWVRPAKSDLMAALHELLTMSASQRDAMGQRGRALVEANYTWDKTAAKFLSVCDHILKGRPVPLHA
jgi:glycosyltransferase involved in cell wall biosynthesis